MSSLAKRAGMHRYYAAHKEEMKAARRAWYAANPEPERAKVRARYRQIKAAVDSFRYGHWHGPAYRPGRPVEFLATLEPYWHEDGSQDIGLYNVRVVG